MSRCFRAEAVQALGEGIYRVHQFTKVSRFAGFTDNYAVIESEVFSVSKTRRNISTYQQHITVALFFLLQVEMFVLASNMCEGILEDLIHMQRDLFAKLGLHFKYACRKLLQIV